MKSFLRSAASVALALLLAVVPVSKNFALAADPVTATVTVATSGSLGAGLGAVATSPVTAVVGALVLGSLGVNAFVSSAAQAQGETKTQWIQRKMQEYAEVQGSNYAQLEKDIAYNTYVTSDGILHLQRSAAEKIKSFGDWLIGGGEADTIPVYRTPPSISIGGHAVQSPTFSTVVNGVSYSYAPDITYRRSDISNGTFFGVSSDLLRYDPVFFAYTATWNNSTGIACYFPYNLVNRGINSVSFGRGYRSGLEGSVIGNYAVVSSAVTPDRSGYWFTYPDYTILIAGIGGSNFLAVDPVPVTSWGDLPVTLPASGIVGSPIDWAENEDVINLGIPDGGAVSVNPDLLGGLDLSNIATDKVIGLGDYLDALADAINGLSDRVIDLHDALALDDVIALPIPDELTPGITVPVDPAITVPDTSVNVIEGTKPADPSDPSNPSNPDTIIANYSYDLTSVFPFCIPFDIVRALEKLNATPEAPAFSYRFKYAAIGLDYTLSVDLSAWDSVAAVLRTMEVLLFTIGLGLVSRKLIMA